MSRKNEPANAGAETTTTHAETPNRTTHTVKTKLTAGGTPVVTTLHVDWTDVTPEMMREWATKTVVIRWQSICRAAGTVPTSSSETAISIMGTRRASGPRPVTIDAVSSAVAGGSLNGDAVLRALVTAGTLTQAQYDAMMSARNAKA